MSDEPEINILVLGDVNIDTIEVALRKSDERSGGSPDRAQTDYSRIWRYGGTLQLKDLIRTAIWGPNEGEEIVGSDFLARRFPAAQEGIKGTLATYDPKKTLRIIGSDGLAGPDRCDESFIFLDTYKQNATSNEHVYRIRIEDIGHIKDSLPGKKRDPEGKRQEKLKSLLLKLNGLEENEAGKCDSPKPSILVIDDFDLGFRKLTEDGSQVLRFLEGNEGFEKDGKGVIVWRMERPLANGKLWDAMTKVKHYTGFDLRLMPSLNDVNGIPTEGKGLVVVALVNNVLHFRIFDGCGRMEMDTDEPKLTEQARQIEDLRKQLESLWPPHELTRSDKDRITTAVASIVGHTHYTDRMVLIVSGESLRAEGVDLRDEDPLGQKARKLLYLLEHKPLSELSKCKLLIIRFNNGVVQYESSTREISAHYHPLVDCRTIEGSFDLGRMIGFSHVLTAAVVSSIARALHEGKDYCQDRYIAAGLRLGVVLGYKLFEDGFGKYESKKAEKGGQPDEDFDPFAKLFINWQSYKEGEKQSRDYDIEIQSTTLPSNLNVHMIEKLGTKPVGSRVLEQWSRVDDYYKCFHMTPIKDAAETVATAIVLQGLDKVSKTPAWKVYEDMLSESGPERPQADKAIQIIRDNEEKAEKELERFSKWAPEPNMYLPYDSFGKIQSIDREEISAFFNIKSLIENYRNHHREKEWNPPLSIAVFGPPGSGKSFTIRQILSTVDPKAEDRPKVEFNIAQFTKVEDLVPAFHLVQDQALQDKALSGDEIPLIVFDEFDTNFGNQQLGWLHPFLMPMQDGLFKSGDNTYRVGRAIFIFSGGTSDKFSDFYEVCMKNKDSKGPDFISRLRGHLDIKTIDSDAEVVSDLLMFRRAIILRRLLEIYLGMIIDKDTKKARMDRDVIKAFLTTPKYKHGLRSMGAIIQMARISHMRPSFQKASIPDLDQLNMHVDAEKFFELVYGYPPYKD